MDRKSCKNCGDVKELDSFPIDKKLLDGRGNWCKECNNQRCRENNKKRIEKRSRQDLNPEGHTHKLCGICRVEKSFSNFSKNIRLKYGLEYACKECVNMLFTTKYRPTYREKSRIYSKRYRSENKDKIKAYSSEYYIKNKPISNFRGKLWRRTNKDYCKSRDHRYRKNNKALCNTHTQARRARKRLSTHPLHNRTIERVLQDMALRLKTCLGIDFHVDHILPLNTGGYHHHINLQVIPGRINESKGDNLNYKHPLLIHWSDLPDFLKNKVKLPVREEQHQE